MKAWKTSLLILLILAMLLPLAPRAAAEEPESPAAAIPDDPRFAGKTWEEVIDRFLDEHNANPDKVALGWCNTVTGEEQYFNGDRYMVSGSMYKVPMNMIFAEKVHNGEIFWDTLIGGYRYEYALHATIVDSNNDVARSMWEYLGGYQPYRHLLAPYMGEDPDTVDEKFYENNYSTPRQMIYALKLLATESERFPRVIDEMLKAEPRKYFKLHEHETEIAHKYGYYTEAAGTRLYLNDCAIVYTSEPMCIVLFTDTVVEPYKLVADFCDLMIDYTEYTSALRLEAERIAAEEAAIAALNSGGEPAGDTPVSPDEPSSVTPTVPAEPAEPPARERGLGPIGAALLLLAVAAAALWCVFAALRRARRGKLRFAPALCAILLAAAALALCVLSQRAETVPAEDAPSALPGDPQGCVTAFCDAVCAGDYAQACSLLEGVSTLGLENPPPTEDAAAIWSALEQQRSYRLYGECRAVPGGALQQVVYVALDLGALSDAVEAATGEKIETLAASLPSEEVYDDEGAYRASFTERAYREALEETLRHAGDYQQTMALNIRLVRGGEDWLIRPDAALYAALTGGLVK